MMFDKHHNVIIKYLGNEGLTTAIPIRGYLTQQRLSLGFREVKKELDILVAKGSIRSQVKDGFTYYMLPNQTLDDLVEVDTPKKVDQTKKTITEKEIVESIEEEDGDQTITSICEDCKKEFTQSKMGRLSTKCSECRYKHKAQQWKDKGKRETEERRKEAEEKRKKEKLGAAYNLGKTCPECGTRITNKAKMCSLCYGKLQEERRENTCVDCGGRIDPNSTRCFSCNQKFEAKKREESKEEVSDEEIERSDEKEIGETPEKDDVGTELGAEVDAEVDAELSSEVDSEIGKELDTEDLGVMYNAGKKCIACGTPITNNATRCIDCNRMYQVAIRTDGAVIKIEGDEKIKQYYEGELKKLQYIIQGNEHTINVLTHRLKQKREREHAEDTRTESLEKQVENKEAEILNRDKEIKELRLRIILLSNNKKGKKAESEDVPTTLEDDIKNQPSTANWLKNRINEILADCLSINDESTSDFNTKKFMEDIKKLPEELEEELRWYAHIADQRT